MASSSSNGLVAPPKIFHALQTGFDQTTRHLGLILFPIALDVFLWLGPQLRVKSLMQPWFDNWVSLVSQSGSPELRELMSLNQAGLQQFIEQFNLFSFLSTFPIGVPSLKAGSLQTQSPFGEVISVNITVLSIFVLAFVLLILAGLALGGLYFSLIAREYQPKKSAGIGALLRQVGSTYTLTFLLLFILLVLLIPTTILALVVGMVSLGLAQFVVMVIFFFSIWLLLPLVFSAHGIYYAGQNPVLSLLSSVRLVRGFMPGTGLFLMASLILNEGMNIIWRIADSQSWMTLIGIFGHGFVVTGLISASFAYYRSGVNWMNDVVIRSMKNATNAA